jgi:hypothetical protein
MQKREIAWIVVLLLVIGAYIHYFGNWGEKKEIQVLATVRPPLQFRRRGGAAAATNAAAYRILFTLDAPYKLTGLELTEVDRAHTNVEGRVLWHLVSQSNSPPVKMFQYGQTIKGLEPDLPGVQPDPLEPGGIYRMEVSAGSLKGASAPFMVPVAPQ